jgi:uncharacterized protein YggE
MMVLVFCVLIGTVRAEETSQIDVLGRGKTSIPPDQIEQYITITAKGNESETALKAAKASAEAVRSILLKHDVKDDRIQNSELEINSNSDDTGKKASKEGYLVKTEIYFNLLNLADYEKLAAELAGVEGVELSKPIYSRSDHDKVKRDTLKKALLNAKEKAVLMADALQVKLGSPVYVVEAAVPSQQGSPGEGVRIGLTENGEATDGTDEKNNVTFESHILVCFGTGEEKGPQRIDVNGRGEVSLRPDQVEMHVTITAVATESEKAFTEVKKRAEAARAMILKRAVKDGRIQKSAVAIKSNDDGKKGAKEGYHAEVDMSFTLLKLADYEKLAAELSGLDGVKISDPQYCRSDRDKLEKDALKKAFVNARENAQFIADTLQVKLGAPVYAAQTDNEAYQGSYVERYRISIDEHSEIYEDTDDMDNVIVDTEVLVHFKINP